MPVAAGDLSFFFFLDFHWLKVFGFENLTAVQTLHIVHAVSSSDHLGAGMLTRGLHKTTLR